MTTTINTELEGDWVDFTSFSRQPNQLIPLLQYCQGQRGYISKATVTQIADYLNVSEALVYGVASFYTQFRFVKPGDHQVRICLGTACHVQGGVSLSEEIQKIIGISPGEISRDQKFEFHEVACLGCCAQAPVVEIDGKIHGMMTRKKLTKVFAGLADREGQRKHSPGSTACDLPSPALEPRPARHGMNQFTSSRQQALDKWDSQISHSDIPVIYLGTASCGIAAGALELLETVQQTVAELGQPVRIVQVGCIGPCYLEPIMDIAMPKAPRVCYTNVYAQKAKQILKDCLIEGKLLRQMAAGHFGDKSFSLKTGIPRFFDLPMLKPQVRVILKNCGYIDPEDGDHYLANDGYLGFLKVLEKGPGYALNALKESGLRGRGGAGFPTFKKWELCRAAQGDHKYVVCNADEGDPGAFMNRALIESDPHAVLEGILIAGYAVGATQGIIYVRAEYPLAVKRLKKAIRQMRDYGLLGEDILDSGFSFDILIKEGAGAFVCGEETALIASLEGKRGMPRPRPPFPSENGYNGCPTLINNTETFGTVPAIMRNGGNWYQQFGVPGNYGTKTFSLVGKALNTGLIEVPLGMSLRQIVEDIGGGTEEPFKAVQTGGPLGGCLSSAQLDTPITYEAMRDQGSIMGSGGLIVMDESTCIVDMAHYFIGFALRESCGNCTPCRIGTRVLIDRLEKIIRGEGEPKDLEMMRRTADTMVKTSLCGLGQAASNPVTSSLNYFLSEYEAHIHHRYCPSAVCKGLFQYIILPKRCNGCTLCAKACPTNAIQGTPKELHALDVTRCTQCHACVEVCNQEAIIGVPLPAGQGHLEMSEALS